MVYGLGYEPYPPQGDIRTQQRRNQLIASLREKFGNRLVTHFAT